LDQHGFALSGSLAKGKRGIWIVPDMATLKQMLKGELIGQMIRYGLSGLALTGFYSAIYLAALDMAHQPPLVANTMAFLFTVVVGYLIHSRWSFRGHGRRDVPVLNTGRFLIVNLLGFALNSFWVWLIAAQLGLSPRLPLIPIIVVTPWLSFWLNRRWTFR
jgi:putative flippase GtrA